jgi:hypothetical protein
LVTVEHVELVLHSVLKLSVLTLVHLNTDLWTSKVSHQKFLDVHICWKVGTDLKTELLAITLYTSPKVEDKQVSEWLLEYVMTVLKWYGVEPRHVKGGTSDTRSNYKKTFNKLAQKHGWMWLWCFPTQCTVSSLNDWSCNWITEKQQIPRSGGSLTKFVAFEVSVPAPPLTAKL